MLLHDLVRRSAAAHPHRLAVCDLDASLTYGELDRLADHFAAVLTARGVRRGDRVVLWTAKSATAVALLQGCLRIGAVYVPVAPSNPPPRLAAITASCTPALVVTDAPGAERARAAGWASPPIATLAELRVEAASPWRRDETGGDSDAAYVLYTSGSTGEPKGVCLSHRNALAFVQWASQAADLTPFDRLANHAPFNFDLSVFDLYAAFHVGASVHLIPEEMGYAPQQLVDFVRQHAITVWYSVPSALQLMMDETDVVDAPPDRLRVCAFAGEPFAGHRVRTLRRAWPHVRMFNWYGPTETNVCLSYEITSAELERDGAIAIGRACSGDQVALVDVGGGDAELVVTGPTVMIGYWGGEPQGDTYRTGDLVRERADGELEFLGRRDHLVKVRGHRVELGEIETVLCSDARVADVVVLALGAGLAGRLHAVVRAKDGRPCPSLLELKRRCAEQLPTYMVIDSMSERTSLPRTANGKTDRRLLAAECG